MARFVKVASVPFVIPDISAKPEDQHLSDFMLDVMGAQIETVLPDKPDLIILPEVCDRPKGMSKEAVCEFYTTRGSRTIDGLCQIARENHCYIAAGIARDSDNGVRYNSCVMIDRQGHVMGYYDKNFIVPTETEDYGIQAGSDIAVFDCDFGRVGAVICFDLNFSELYAKYRDADCDLIVFPSHFDGGHLCNIFAHETGAYFVSCYTGKQQRAVALDPLGYQIAANTNYHPNLVVTLNLDYQICHLDKNRAKLAEAKQKYGSQFQIRDNSYIGTLVLTSESQERICLDIVREFDITLRSEYFAQARQHRENSLKNQGK